MNARPPPRTLLAGILVLALAGWTRAESVVAEGSAPGDTPNARERALTDALREAVRIGAGVNLESKTLVKDFVLEYDRVFEQAFGYVKDYRVLSSGVRSEDRLYHVKVRAEVNPGSPDLKEEMALRQIVRLKQSPRVALEVDELIEGVPPGSEFARGWFEQAARECQLQLVETRRAIRGPGLSPPADFILQAKVRGRSLGTERLYGAAAAQRFTFSVDLSVLRPDTSEIVISLPLPDRDLSSPLPGTEAAARDLVHRLLSGRSRAAADNGWALFRRMFRIWVTELDLGAIVHLEFPGIRPEEWVALQSGLAGAEKVSSVWPREFDARGISRMDIETRLDANGVAAVVRGVLGGAFDLDRGTRSALGFARAGNGPAKGARTVSKGVTFPPETGAGEGKPATKGGKGTIPVWAWVVIVAGGVGALGGAYALGRGRTTASEKLKASP